MKKRLLILLLLFFSLSLQAQQERKLPAGEWCQNTFSRNVKAHVCDCKRVCSNTPGNPSVVIEDPHCQSYCHPDQCTCGVKGCP